MKISFAQGPDEFSFGLRQQVFARLSQEGHRYGDKSTILKSLFWLVCLACSYSLAIRTGESLVARFLFGVVAAYSLFFFVINTCHDAVHGCLWRSRKLNWITHTLFFNLLGVDSRLWGIRHLKAHHIFPNIPGCDSDIDETVIIRLSPHNQWRFFYRFQHWYAPLIYAILPLHSVFYQDVAYLFRQKIANVKNLDRSPKVIGQFVFLKSLYLFFWILAPWWISGESLSTIIMGYVMINFALGLAFIPIAATHLNAFAAHPLPNKQNQIPSSYAKFQIASSLDWSPLSPIATFFYGGLNSHAAHHLFPRISHRHYHWITEIIYAECAKRNLAYHQTSFFGCVYSHFKYLKLLGTTKDIQLNLREAI
jgi:linoleoyl-CoA desaturase